MNFYEAYVTILPRLQNSLKTIEESILLKHPDIYVYNPFSYGAINCYLDYLKKYYKDTWPQIIIVGQNPGINGAVQTGIPFTDPLIAKHKLGIDILALIEVQGPVHPRRYLQKHEKSSKIVWDTAEKTHTIEDFASKVLPINALPVGIGKESKRRNNGNFFVKNVDLGDLDSSVLKLIKEQCASYCVDLLAIFNEAKKPVLLISLSSIANDILTRNALWSAERDIELWHPSSRNHKHSDGKWEEKFSEALLK